MKGCPSCKSSLHWFSLGYIYRRPGLTWSDLWDNKPLKGRVERIFFFASFKLPLFNEYEMVFIIA